MTIKWYYAKDDNRVGPVEDAEFRQIAESGGLEPFDRVWKKGMKQWKPAAAVPGVLTTETASPASFQEWYYAEGIEKRGPVSFERLEQLVAERQLGPSDWVWNDSLDEWKPVCEVAELSQAIGAARISATPNVRALDSDSLMKNFITPKRMSTGGLLAVGVIGIWVLASTIGGVDEPSLEVESRPETDGAGQSTTRSPQDSGFDPDDPVKSSEWFFAETKNIGNVTAIEKRQDKQAGYNASNTSSNLAMRSRPTRLLTDEQRYEALVSKIRPGMTTAQVAAVLGQPNDKKRQDLGDLNPTKRGQILEIWTWETKATIMLSFVNGTLQDGGTPGYDIRKGFKSKLPNNASPAEEAKLRDAARRLGITIREK